MIIVFLNRILVSFNKISVADFEIGHDVESFLKSLKDVTKAQGDKHLPL